MLSILGTKLIKGIEIKQLLAVEDTNKKGYDYYVPIYEEVCIMKTIKQSFQRDTTPLNYRTFLKLKVRELQVVEVATNFQPLDCSKIFLSNEPFFNLTFRKCDNIFKDDNFQCMSVKMRNWL